MISHPFQAVSAEQSGETCVQSVWGRRYTHAASALPTSIVTQGRELLYAPVRVTGLSCGKPIEWKDESCYLLEAGREEPKTVNGCAQSDCLILDTSFTVDVDGTAVWDLKVMPRGLTVPQLFGVEAGGVKEWGLERLWLELPLRKDAMRLYYAWPLKDVRGAKGEALASGGEIPEGGISMDFRPAVFLSNEAFGLSLNTESDEYWQPEDPDRAIEIVDEGDHWVLRCRLLDSMPEAWGGSAGRGSAHICYRFYLTATPVKPMDEGFARLHVLHIDCFEKIEGDYWPFFSGKMPVTGENVLDRLCRAGVNVLILHEKWNKMQNSWRYAVQTAEEIEKLVAACHERGIRVLPYFGYEITSAAPDFPDVREAESWLGTENGYQSGWYRVPWQRAAPTCYRSERSGKLVKGILDTIDRFGFDGVYLDSLAYPRGCVNERHGCGWRDQEGALHATYPLRPVRETLRAIYEGVHARHGIVNVHPGGSLVPMIESFADSIWDGEHIQISIRENGLENFSLPYFRSEYLGSNLGVPVQFIVYEFKGTWSFDMALSLALIHGVYPRPNSVLHPLDVMERIWKITDAFGIADAKFTGYWENDAVTSPDASIRVSYYQRTDPDGTVRLLVYTGNPSGKTAESVLRVRPEAFGKKSVVSVYDADAGRACGEKISCGPYSLGIRLVVLR